MLEKPLGEIKVLIRFLRNNITREVTGLANVSESSEAQLLLDLYTDLGLALNNAFWSKALSK